MKAGWLENRLLIGTDIAGYGARDPADQLVLQVRLRSALELAADWLGVRREAWTTQPVCDGELAILPADTDLCGTVGLFPSALKWALAELNADEDVRLRVRLAFHMGLVGPGVYGAVGEPPGVLRGILGAMPLRDMLAVDAETDLVFALSDRVYAEVVGTGFCTLQSRAYRPAQITVSGRPLPVHVHDPVLTGGTEPL